MFSGCGTGQSRKEQDGKNLKIGYEEYTGFEMVLVTDDGRTLVSGGLTDAFEPNGERTVEYVRR